MQANIQKWGNSQGIRIPKYIIEALGIKENEKLDISTNQDKIIIAKAQKKKRKNIKELFTGYNGNYKTDAIEYGEPVGREIW